MSGVSGAVILGLGLLIFMSLERRAFFEANIFIVVMLAVDCLLQRSLPSVDAVWVYSWIAYWVYVFIVVWFFDIICISVVSSVIYTVVVSVGFYYFQLYAPAWGAYLLS